MPLAIKVSILLYKLITMGLKRLVCCRKRDASTCGDEASRFDQLGQPTKLVCMKITALLFFTFLAPLIAKSQILVRVHLKYNLEIGHGTTMDYSFADLMQLNTCISSIDTMTEKSILNCFRYPISGSGDVICLVKTNTIHYETVFKSIKCKKIQYNTRCINASIGIVKAEYSTCIHPIMANYWGGLAVVYDSAVVVTSHPEILQFSKKELNDIKLIKNNFNAKCH